MRRADAEAIGSASLLVRGTTRIRRPATMRSPHAEDRTPLGVQREVASSQRVGIGVPTGMRARSRHAQRDAARLRRGAGRRPTQRSEGGIRPCHPASWNQITIPLRTMDELGRAARQRADLLRQRSSLHLASLGRQDAQSFTSTDPVGLEVVVVDREDCRERFTLRQMHERSVRVVHRPVLILAHERLDVRQVPIR